MPYTPPTVNYATDLDATYTTLTGVQSVNIARGRQYFQDNFPASSCVIDLIPANSYTTPLAIGQFIDVRDANSGTSPCYFAGQITDIQRTYAMPYNSGTGAAPGDRITITATGCSGLLGNTQRTNITNTSSATFVTGFAALCQAIDADSYGAGTLSQDVSTSTYNFSASLLDVMNILLRTQQAVIDDSDMERTKRFSTWTKQIMFCQIGYNLGRNYTFADTGSGQRFKSIEYSSSAQTTFNRVQVEPDGLAVQSVEGTGTFNTLVYDTVNASTSDALSLANYLYNLLSGQLAPVPYRIGTDTTIAASCMDLIKLSTRTNRGTAIGQEVAITFRGSTVTGIIQGFNATFDIDKGSLVVYLSPSLGQPFTLDSTFFGVLDTNRLGYP